MNKMRISALLFSLNQIQNCEYMIGGGGEAEEGAIYLYQVNSMANMLILAPQDNQATACKGPC